MAEFKGVAEKFHVSLVSEDGASQRVICQARLAMALCLVLMRISARVTRVPRFRAVLTQQWHCTGRSRRPVPAETRHAEHSAEVPTAAHQPLGAARHPTGAVYADPRGRGGTHGHPPSGRPHDLQRAGHAYVLVYAVRPPVFTLRWRACQEPHPLKQQVCAAGS